MIVIVLRLKKFKKRAVSFDYHGSDFKTFPQ